MPNMSAQALRTAVTQAAISDPAFRGELEKNAVQAIEGRFGKQVHRIEVVFEKESELPLLVPEKTEQLARSIERTVKDVGNRNPTRGQFEAILIQRAWSDAAFLDQLRSDARGTLDGALKKYGSSVPAGKTVRLYEEKAGQCVIVVPRPANTNVNEELTDSELEAVAGGEAVVAIIVGGVIASTAGVIVNEWVCS